MFKPKTVVPWLSDSGQPYPVAEMPFLYDPSRYAFVRHVEANFHVIRDELLDVLRRDDGGLTPYRDLAKTDRKSSWHTAGLMYWTRKSFPNIKRFPRTWAVFKDIENLTSCSIHRLQPHSMIKPHIGDTDAMLRCHMGLVVPASLPRCGFRVGKETVSWEEGRVFIFNDAQEHTAWNNTDHDRYVISFDVMLPQYFGIRHWIAAQVLGKIAVEVWYQHHPKLARWITMRWQQSLLIAMAKCHRYLSIRARYFLSRAPMLRGLWQLPVVQEQP